MYYKELIWEKKMTDVLDILRMSDIADPIEEIKIKTVRPKMYQVIFLNDDFTPMDFVTAILQQIFNKSQPEAIAITYEIHHQDKGIVGIYTREIAEQKSYETMENAKLSGHPLVVITEPVD